MTKSYRLDWNAGASVQLEIFRPELGKGKSAKTNYQLKYIPPFRSTIRPPVYKPSIGPDDLEPITQQLDGLAASFTNPATRNSGTTYAAAGPATTSADTMRDLGGRLFDLLTPKDLKVELRGREFYLEIGMDEDLLGYPWELMHDGDDFLCLKHFMGRAVNASNPSTSTLTNPKNWIGAPLQQLSVLLISVPRPAPRADGKTFESLTQVDEETKAIVDTLANVDGVKLVSLSGKNATYENVYKELKNNSYHIVHFSGHAIYDEKNPSKNGLALYNDNMPSGALASFLSNNPPLLCFMNACETMKSARPGTGKGWNSRYNIFDMARALLETGSYLLGSRWKLGDKAAAAFAASFYSSLVKNEKSLGYSITEARKSCRQAAPEDPFSWISYIYYGDPRLCFKQQTDGIGAAPANPPTT